MARVLIIGCGDVGIALGRRLAAEGHLVYGLRRRANAVPPPMIALAGDVRDPRTLSDLPLVDYAFYLAAADGYTDAAYRAVYVRGVANVLQSLKDNTKLRWFVFASSTAVYGQQDGAWVDETSATAPGGFSGRRLLEGERSVLGSPFPATVVRFAGIYGPGRRYLIERVRNGESCVGEPVLYTNRIHRDDCVGMLQHLMRLERPAPCYVGVDSEPAAECVVMDWLAGQLKVAPPRRIAAANIAGFLQRANKRCRNARVRASGYRFRYPTFREGYLAVIAGLEGGEAGDPLGPAKGNVGCPG